jgi:glucose-6-phosphate isomerase
MLKDMDTHFVETNAPHNIPVLLALCDVWNEAFMKSSGRILLPFMEHLSSYPAFVAAVESQVYGRYERQRGSSETNTSLATAVAIDGGLFGSYDRVCFQGGRTLPSELVITMDSQVFSSNAATKLFGPESSSDIIAGHDALVCSFFAHADVLAFGSNGVNPASNRENSGGVLHINGPAPGMAKSVSFDSNASNFPDSEGSNGNRPSTLLILNRCDPFACGQLVALAEHRSIIAARCWGVENPFSFSQSYGTSIRSTQTELMKEKLFVVFQKLAVGQSDEDDDDAMLTGPRVNLATSTLLSSYASRNSKPTY